MASAALLTLFLLAACDSARPGSVGRMAEPPRVDPAIDEALAGGPAAEAREG